MKVFVMGTGQGLGGLHTHFQRLLRFFVAEGHETSAFVVADEGQRFAMPEGVKNHARIPHSASTVWQKTGKYLALRRLAAEVRCMAPELFIAAATGRAYAKIARSARSRGTFTIWQEVVLPSADDPLHSELGRSVDAVAVQTPAMLEPFRRAIPTASRVGCLPCFFEPVMTESAARPPGQGEPVRLAFFGRLARNKGIVPFLRVFREVSNSTKMLLDLYGGGAEHSAIEHAISDLGLGGIATLKGRYPDGAEYGRLLTSYHALVLPSIECEGLPLVLLEAMSCGLPLLATDIGGIADVAVNNPDVVVVAPEGAALAEGLHQLVALLKSGAISNKRLKAHAVDHFSNQRFAATWRTMLADPRRFFAPR